MTRGRRRPNDEPRGGGSHARRRPGRRSGGRRWTRNTRTRSNVAATSCGGSSTGCRGAGARSRGGARGRGGGARDARRRRPARGIRSSRPRESRSTFARRAGRPAEPPEPAGEPGCARGAGRVVRAAARGSGPTGRRRSARTWLLAAAVAVLVLLVGGIALLGPVRDALAAARTRRVRARADPEELDRADEVATGAGLQTSDIASLRSLGRAFGHDFWVFRDDRVCLISRREFFFDGWRRARRSRCRRARPHPPHPRRRSATAPVRDGSDRATWSW